MIIKKLLLSIFVFTALVGVTLKQAWACNCPTASYTAKASKEHIETAAMIFEGKVRHVFPGTDSLGFGSGLHTRTPVHLDIYENYKGSKGEESVSAYIDMTTSCGKVFKRGDTGFFILHRKNDKYVELPCNYISPEDMKVLKTKKLIDALKIQVEEYLKKEEADEIFQENLTVKLNFPSREAIEEWVGGGTENITFHEHNLVMANRRHNITLANPKSESVAFFTEVNIFVQNADGSYTLVTTDSSVAQEDVVIKQSDYNLQFITKRSRQVILELNVEDSE